MIEYDLTFKPFSETSILIEWPQEINEKILNDLLLFKNSIKAHLPKSILQIINSYNSLLVIYKFTIEDVNDEIMSLKELYSSSSIEEHSESSNWNIPVCYDQKFGIDLDRLASLKKCSIQQIIDWHSQPNYLVYCIGFLPGFLYLGGLNPKLMTPRLKSPRLHINKGAVGIAGDQTGIYPNESPGGWNIIGNSPIELFYPESEPPCFIKAGDTVSFYPISTEEYDGITSQVKEGRFNLIKLKQA